MLLTTKFFVPQRRADLVKRSRLLSLLDQLQTARLILVSAPAGFGKTTLVAEWIDQLRSAETPSQLHYPPSALRNPLVSWLSLDESDNDPIRFVTYLVAALQKVEATVGVSVQMMLQAPQPPPLDALLTMVINDLSIVSGSILLVLDDYHVITTQAIHEAITFLIEHLPPSLKIVMTTRIDPPLPLSRWRVRRVMTEIRQRDLRFAEEETATFLHDALGVEFTMEDVKALETRTEGWIAGLQLAALSMQGREDPGEFIRRFTGSNTFVLDYLGEEVLQHLPEPTYEFLLRSAILERLCAPLCNAVTGRSDGQAMLESLLQSNLFLIPLDDQRVWFRYHHLFGDVLQKRLSQRQPAHVGELHRRACQWYLEQGLMLEAIQHSLAAGDFHRAGELIEANAHLWRNHGEHVTLANLLRQIPKDVLKVRPGLCLEKGNIHMFYHQLDEAEQWLVAAEQALEGSGQRDRLLEGKIAAVRCDVALNRGAVKLSIRLGELALSCLPEDELYTRSYALFLLAIAYSWCGHNSPESETADEPRSTAYYEQAHQAFAQSALLAQQADFALMTVYALAAHAQLHLRLGQWRSAYTDLQQSLRYAGERGVEQSLITCSSYVHLGEVYFEYNDLDAAEQHFSTGLRLAQMAQNPRTQLSVYIRQIPLYAAQNNKTKLRLCIEQANLLMSEYQLPPAMVNDFRIAQVQHELHTGLSASAGDWLHALKASGSDRVETDMANPNLLWARLYLQEAQFERAQQCLANTVQHALEIGEIPIVIHALVLLCCAAIRMGKQHEAQNHAIQMLNLAEPLGFLRTILDGGEEIRGVLRTIQKDNLLAGQANLHRYVERLVAAFPLASQSETQQASLAISTEGQNAQGVSAGVSLIEPLSERELEVFRLVAAGLSNNQIADKLIVTVGTVKKHLNTIYGKLGVGSRTQAIVRAREVKLL